MKKMIVLVLLAGCGFLMAQENNDPLAEKPNQYKKETKDIAAKLSDEATWADAKIVWNGTIYVRNEPKIETLLKYLELASILRCENIEEILARHISYSPYEGQLEKRLISTEEKYPVYATLYRMGIKSINPLVKLLRTTDPNKPYDNSANLATLCLANIYEQGGYGKEMSNQTYNYEPAGQGKNMAKQRLLLELGKASGKEKEYLERAIKHPVIDPDGIMKPVVSVERLPEQYKKDIEAIISKLSNPDTWKDTSYTKDKTKTEILLKYLELAYTIRCEGIEQILANYITYSPYEEEEARRTIEQNYPVYDTLSKIGVRSVMPLINLLKSINPAESKDRTIDLIIRCLAIIYEQGGFGKEMTRYRLQLEIDNSKGKEKEYLEKTLNHPLLKEK